MDAAIFGYEELLACRAGKLLKKGKYFICIAHDEPYFNAVYGMIRDSEIINDRWSDEDEIIYQWATSDEMGKVSSYIPQE